MMILPGADIQMRVSAATLFKPPSKALDLKIKGAHHE
jgi:hypothetical protein